MFGFGKSKTTKILEGLIEQEIGGQSYIYNFFIKELEVPADNVRKLELTYFSLSVLTYIFLRFYQGLEKEQILDGVALYTIDAGIKFCGEEISIEEAVDEYQQRYKEYDAFLTSYFSKAEIGKDPQFILAMRLYYCVTQNRPENALELIPFITEFILANLDFVKNKLPT